MWQAKQVVALPTVPLFVGHPKPKSAKAKTIVTKSVRQYPLRIDAFGIMEALAAEITPFATPKLPEMKWNVH
ncbi:MAG: hypothetical protein WC655_01265 [Candidatus Hydrogenedentales bacterium]